MPIIEFLDQHSGSLMVIITFIYVVATIGIFVENQKSSKASRDQLAKSQQQLEESRKQFDVSQIQLEETRRLEHMPFLMIEIPLHSESPLCEIELTADLDNSSNGYRILFLKNIGNGTATNIVYSWKCGDVFECDPFPVSSVMKGDGLFFQITMQYDDYKEEKSSGVMVLQFDDLMGKSYEQSINIKYECGIVTNVEVCPPEYRGTIYYSLAKEKQIGNGDTNA